MGTPKKIHFRSPLSVFLFPERGVGGKMGKGKKGKGGKDIDRGSLSSEIMHCVQNEVFPRMRSFSSVNHRPP
jgi:hypothetical protein